MTDIIQKYVEKGKELNPVLPKTLVKLIPDDLLSCLEVTARNISTSGIKLVYEFTFPDLPDWLPIMAKQSSNEFDTWYFIVHNYCNDWIFRDFLRAVAYRYQSLEKEKVCKKVDSKVIRLALNQTAETISKEKAGKNLIQRIWSKLYVKFLQR